MSAPYLSVVATSRNDNHGGSLTRRMQIFVSSFIDQCKRHNLSAELLLVEWNPPEDRVSLADVLDWPEDCGPCSVRIITVPAELHQRFKCSESLPLFQMIAKNVGLRRAKGRFAIATNIDLVFSDELCRFLASEELDEEVMYRIDRHDVEAEVPLAGSLEDRLAYCQAHLIRVNALEGTFPLNASGLRDRFPNDVTEPGSDILFGSGWFAPESCGVTRQAYRWAGQESELWFSGQPGPKTDLYFSCEPGPSARGGPLTLRFLQDGQELATARICAKELVHIRLSTSYGERRKLNLKIEGGGHRVADYSRILDLRINYASHTPPSEPLSIARSPRLISKFIDTAKRGYRTLRSNAQLGIDYPESIHTNACGDFTLLSTRRWIELQGYAEFEMYSMHIDGLFCYEAFHAGLREQILPEPMRIYHIEHGAGWTPEGDQSLFEGLESRGIAYLTYQDFLDYIVEMKKTGTPLRPNAAKGQSWGLGLETLPEFTIRHART